MKTWIKYVTCVLVFVTSAHALPYLQGAQYDTGLAPGSGQFETVDIYVEAGAKELAAYQVEISVPAGISVLGIESGAAPFADAPYYDPQAMRSQKLVLAGMAKSWSQTDSRHRVATIHLERQSNQPLSVKPIVIGDKLGNKINATIDLQVRGQSQ